jgi:hypothetical protein
MEDPPRARNLATPPSVLTMVPVELNAGDAVEVQLSRAAGVWVPAVVRQVEDKDVVVVLATGTVLRFRPSEMDMIRKIRVPARR